MASRVPCGTWRILVSRGGLLTFRKRAGVQRPVGAGTRGPEASYGAGGPAPVGPGRGCRPSTEEELDAVALVLKSCLPAMIALFSTLLTDEFLREYEVADRGQAPVAGPQSWTARMFRAADRVRFGGRAELGLAGEWQASVVREATLRSAVAVSTLFASREPRIERFVKRMVCRHNDKRAKRADFYTAWSTLATPRSPAVNQPSSPKGSREATSKEPTPAWSRWRWASACRVPPRTEAAGWGGRLGGGLSSDRPRNRALGAIPRQEVRPSTPLEADKPERGQRGSGRKRRTPCSSAYYEVHGGRLGEKTMRMRDASPARLHSGRRGVGLRG
ncbi:hypothetical protein Q5P01_000318 [Channa striata]|uniref:Uncharacterized protein n=1 Tax=Channa striata TaxID=64152 RepID=A0AA88IIS6_CHASR|nr:hypothetical protein Q5P01_000318 [Channa striata]